MSSDMSISICGLLLQSAYAIKTHLVSCEKINYSNSDTVYILTHNDNVEVMLFLNYKSNYTLPSWVVILFGGQ